jgi:hypothetical protein
MQSSAKSSFARALDHTCRWLWLALVALTLACGGQREAEPAARGVSSAALSAETAPVNGIEKLPFDESTLASLEGASVMTSDALDDAASEDVETCDAGGDPETLVGYWCNCVLTDEVNGWILRATVRCRGRAGCSPCCRAFWDAHM